MTPDGRNGTAAPAERKRPAGRGQPSPPPPLQPPPPRQGAVAPLRHRSGHRARPHRRRRPRGRCVHGAQAFINSCSLASLKPVSIGENSFVYAADGSVLGSIPAEQNRQPVALDQMSPFSPRPPWRSRTSGSTRTRRRLRRHHPRRGQEPPGGEIVQGGLDAHAAARPNLYIGRDVSWERKTKEACLAPSSRTRAAELWGSMPAGLTPEEAKRWRRTGSSRPT